MKITTSHEIYCGGAKHVWAAVDEDTFDSMTPMIGWGSNEMEAVDNLKCLLNEKANARKE